MLSRIDFIEGLQVRNFLPPENLLAIDKIVQFPDNHPEMYNEKIGFIMIDFDCHHGLRPLPLPPIPLDTDLACLCSRIGAWNAIGCLSATFSTGIVGKGSTGRMFLAISNFFCFAVFLEKMKVPVPAL